MALQLLRGDFHFFFFFLGGGAPEKEGDPLHPQTP